MSRVYVQQISMSYDKFSVLWFSFTVQSTDEHKLYYLFYDTCTCLKSWTVSASVGSRYSD
jgi:hypothetical protein